jgi:arylformamidase
MELIDITVPIREGMVTYPGDPSVHMERVSSIEKGDVANLTRLDFGVHSGTHIDAPVHFIDGGKSVESLPLDVLLGPVEVVEAALDGGDVAEEDVARVPGEAERVLFKTRNSELWAKDEFDESFAKLTESAARALVERGVRLVGVDYLSVGDPAAHHALLGAAVVAIEGLDLRGVEPGRYRLVCLPLKLEGSDGGPARAVLIRD